MKLYLYITFGNYESIFLRILLKPEDDILITVNTDDTNLYKILLLLALENYCYNFSD